MDRAGIRAIRRPVAACWFAPTPTCEHLRMRAVVQRVLSAAVTSRAVGESDAQTVGRIGPGMCVLVGVTHTDDRENAEKLAAKLYGLRIFDDADGVMNLAAPDVGGEFLVVSQFTLYGDTRRGRRPSWTEAAPTRACRAVGRSRRRRASSVRGGRRDRSLPNGDGGRSRQRRAGDAGDRRLISRGRQLLGVGGRQHRTTPTLPRRPARPR